MEAEVRLLRRHFAYRAQSLRNQPRTNQLLRLMVAGRNGEADERVCPRGSQCARGAILRRERIARST